MYNFDEKKVMCELGVLPAKARVAFATAAATRQIENYERYARRQKLEASSQLREIIAQLWCDLRAEMVNRTVWSERLGEVMNLLPEENDDWGIAHALADDAASSLAYAIRCLLSSEPQEAAWAARRAYEAADQAAIRVLDIQPGLSVAEVIIRSHDIVQRELERQHNDLSLLKVAGSIDEMQGRALRDQLLTEEEFAVLG